MRQRELGEFTQAAEGQEGSEEGEQEGKEGVASSPQEPGHSVLLFLWYRMSIHGPGTHYGAQGSLLLNVIHHFISLVRGLQGLPCL